ncbi:Partner of Y14 and Mago [Carabus blaptoides fortunei]
MDSKELENGGSFIPASQRPDGTWRKPRRVKEGYVPQEEVPLYESKGKQFMNRKPQVATGGRADVSAHHTIPGLYIQEDKVKKEKKKSKTQSTTTAAAAQAVENVRKSLSQTKITDSSPTVQQQEPAKRLKGLKKRLREIEALEEKIHAGDIKNPEKEQLDKVARKKEVIKEIRMLEAAN